MHRVLRVIQGPAGKAVAPGEIVDASAWRNLRALTAAGKIVEIVDDEAPVAAPAVKKAAKKAVPKPVVVEAETE